MAHTLESISHWTAGDTRVLTFTVPDEDAASDTARKNLTGATISWTLRNTAETVVLSSDDPTVSVAITDAVNGEFRVDVDAGATDGFTGTYYERLRITDQSGNRHTWDGKVRFEQ